jgi:transglutaminase-like putative cysteine protease
MSEKAFVMILEVQHETRLQYSEPISEWLTEVRMEPVSDDRQSCHSFHLRLSEASGVFRYRDGFGNRVHHFNLLVPHKEVRMLAASLVETYPNVARLESSSSSYPLVACDLPLEVYDFLSFRGPTSSTPLLNPILDVLRPELGTPLGRLVANVSEYIHAHFEYAGDVTSASSPIAELLEHRKGVCQDFAHLMIAILRSFGIPTRYVSGYIHRENKESQSHAWCEAWLPDLGWVGVDPTNNCVVNDHFIEVAIGRDFTDVPPNKGVYRGRGEETILVRVETRALDRMPSLSWQEHLRPLDVPLTAMRGANRPGIPGDEQMEQQQQQ